MWQLKNLPNDIKAEAFDDFVEAFEISSGLSELGMHTQEILNDLVRFQEQLNELE